MLLELRQELRPEKWRRLGLCVQLLTRTRRDFHHELQDVCRDARVIQAQSAAVGQAVEESIQDLRLMPLGPFLDGFAKIARDAARRDGKELRFEARADDAEVDRAVLLRLHEALIHVVRNAVVHGIESGGVRAMQGKPREGRLTLEACLAGSHAVIRISDDGAGVDAARVREKARALAIPDAEDVLDILTHPGFSTRSKVDDLAGRGVGLDVVANVVRGLEGSLELTTTRDVGSVFTIRVPIAASTTRGLVLEVGERSFGIMLSAVERVLRPTAAEIMLVEGRAAVRVEDEMVALVALSDLLGIEESDDSQGERIAVVVLRQGRRRLALSLHEIPSEHALVVRPFGRAFRGAELFVGGAVQPDHSVIPVLSTAALFTRASQRSSSPVKRPRAAARPTFDIHALVVDDSITMRTMLRNILSAAGYRVTVAEDGEAALRTLQEMEQCHVVVTDLQMPHMDGAELCRNIRARPGSYLPIIMVTSVDDPEEKAKALAAGADAYLVKGHFEQVAFLQRIDGLVRGPQ
jgi:chemotaxis protein histidine kinase CheA